MWPRKAPEFGKHNQCILCSPQYPIMLLVHTSIRGSSLAIGICVCHPSSLLSRQIDSLSDFTLRFIQFGSHGEYKPWGVEFESHGRV